MAQLRWGASTNPGLVRADNEDTFVAEPMVFAVADGMGGHQAGEVASALAASIMRDRLGNGAANEDEAINAVLEANAAIHGAARANSLQSGMGTTLTAIAVLNERGENLPEQLVLLNVGDSRTYRIRNGAMQRVTVDHSYVQELVATGHITMEEARTHPRRNIVTRALGIEPNVRTDMWTLPIVRGDRFLLCSDGLVDEVPDDEILEFVLAADDPQALAEQLVAAANRHGGRDNVTVVVVDVLEGDDPPDPTGELNHDPTAVASAQIWADAAYSSDLAMGEPTQRAAAGFPTLPPPAAPLGETPSADETLAVPPASQTPVPDTTDLPEITDIPEITDTPDTPDTTDTTDVTDTDVTVVADTPALVATQASPSLPAAASQPFDPTDVRSDSTSGDATTTGRRRKRRFTGGVFLFIVVLAAILTVTFTLVAVHARSGYFVGFDGDRVVVYKGQPGGLLWFEPTVAEVSDRTRGELDPTLIAVIEKHVTYDSVEQAAAFINEQVIPTTVATVPATEPLASTPSATAPPGQTTTTVPTGG